MNYEINNGVLIITLVNNISSNNATEIDEEIAKIREKEEYKSFVIDAKDLTYISSAGLRVLLKYTKLDSSMKVINVNNEVYDIFSITGFATFLNIERKKREISIENATLIGDGYTSKVYRIDKDTIVKVFANRYQEEDIKKELDLAKQAFIAGVPTAISYDLVNVGNNLGVVFEMLDCDTLKDLIKKYPEKLDEYIKYYTKLLRKINSTEAFVDKIPSAKAKMLSNVEFIKNALTNEEYTLAKSLVEGIKDTTTYVHGDCHIKNIMVNAGEFLLIDMETISYGNPIFELVPLYACYHIFEEYNARVGIDFFRVGEGIPQRMFDEMIPLYFEGLSEEEINENLDKIKVLTYIYMMWYCKRHMADEAWKFEIVYNRFKDSAYKINDLNLKI